MSRRSYSTEILISTNPEAVYKAITNDIDKWRTESSNQAQKVGDRLIVRFEKRTSWVMTVSEAYPNRSLIWKVVEANHNLEGISTRDEWKGTTIKWKIEGNETGSRITFIHEGLVPALPSQ